jgi:uncharacterized membrane protein YhaH (DUF805 family)
VPDDAAIGSRPAHTAVLRTGVWLAGNLALGYGLAFPLTSAVVFGYYVRAHLWGDVPAPYHSAEAQIGAAFALVGVAVLGVVAVLVNRRLRRRPPGWPAVLFWPATVILLITPCLLFTLNESTVPQMLGKGLLW